LFLIPQNFILNNLRNFSLFFQNNHLAGYWLAVLSYYWAHWYGLGALFFTGNPLPLVAGGLFEKNNYAQGVVCLELVSSGPFCDHRKYDHQRAA